MRRSPQFWLGMLTGDSRFSLKPITLEYMGARRFGMKCIGRFDSCLCRLTNKKPAPALTGTGIERAKPRESNERFNV